MMEILFYYLFLSRSNDIKYVSSVIMKVIGKFQNIQVIKSVNGEKHNLSEYELLHGFLLGVDTHADTLCAGRHVRVIKYIGGKKYSVAPFHGSYKPKTNVEMINGVVAIDNSNSSGFFIELDNFLDFSDSMDDSILVLM